MAISNPATPGGAATDKATTGTPRFSLKPSRQTAILLGSLTALLLAASVGFYLWQDGEVKAMERERAQKRADYEAGEKVAARLDSVQQAYDETARKIASLEPGVTKGDYIPSLLKQMDAFAKQVSLEVNGSKFDYVPAPPEPKDPEARKKWVPQPYDTVKIEMRVRGTYWDIARFLYRLPDFQKILQVESLRIDPPGAGASLGGTPMLASTLNVTGFVFKDDLVKAQAREVEAARVKAGTPPSGLSTSGMPGGLSVPPVPNMPTETPKPIEARHDPLRGMNPEGAK